MQEIHSDQVIDWLPVRSPDAYKNQMGQVLLIGGNQQMGGAIIMATLATVKGGAGLVTVASHTVNRTALHCQLPEAMFIDYQDLSALKQAIQEADVVALGPGLGRDAQARLIFDRVLNQARSSQVLIIDADGLNLLAQLDLAHVKGLTADLILTPHPGEWRRLTSSFFPELLDQDLRPDQVKGLSRELSACLVLKGSPTQVVTAEQIYRNTTGNPSQATGGMGDTLTGIIAAFVAQSSADARDQAVLSAVYIHSYIADQLAEDYYVSLPTQISHQLPRTMRDLMKRKEDRR